MDYDNTSLLVEKMALDKILFLSFCMPPLKYPRSIQISRLLKNMPIKPNVIYADEKENKDLTILPNMQNFVNESIQIPFDNGNRYISFFKRKMFPLIYNSPDIHKFWSYELYNKARAFIENKPQDMIVTFGQPMSVHIAGLKLKEKYSGIKWAAHFSDPWVDNPLNKKGFFTKLYNSYLEARVFRNADKLIFTSKETMELIAKRYPSSIIDKFEYLPHAYDETLYNYNQERDEEIFKISYIGGFYAQRSPKPLFDAVYSIFKENSEILHNVKFQIVGNMGRHSTLVDKYKMILPYFEFIKNVPYDESLELMVKSNLLLVIDAPADVSVFFPSKLVDYIGSRRPIIGITPNGTSSSIIKSLGGKCADPLNSEEVRNMLVDVLSNKEDYKNFEVSDRYFEYEASIVTKKFFNILSQLGK